MFMVLININNRYYYTSFSITKPKFERDKFILFPSYRVLSVAFVLESYSLPAKSTNDNID